MKVVFVNRYFWPDESATSQILSDLAFHLAENGFEVEIVTANQLYTDAKQRMQPLERKPNLTIRRLWTTRFGRGNLLGRFLDYLTFYINAQWQLIRLAGRVDWMVLKTDPPMLSVLGSVAKLFGSFKMVAWCQDVFPEIAFAKSQNPVMRFAGGGLAWVRNLSLRRAEKIVVLGEDMKAFFEGQQVEAECLAVLPNWADGKGIVPVEREENPLRDKWKLGQACVVGYSGNLGRVHEYQTLLQAAERVAEKTTDLRLLFIGSGALQQKLKADLSSSLRAVTQFQPYQPREQLSQSLSVPDVHWVSLDPHYAGYVLPSKLYGILAAGRPVLFIGEPQSFLGREIEEQGIGYTCGLGDIDRLAECLARLIHSPKLRQQMGQRAREYFEANYDFHRTAKKWEQLLTEV